MDSLSAADRIVAALSMRENQQKLIANKTMASALNFLQNKKYPEAIAQLKRTIALDPEMKEAYSYLGNTYLQQGNTTDAIRVFKQYLRNHPFSGEGNKDLANAYLQAKEYGEAEKQLKNLAKIDPTDTYAPYTLGQLYVQTGRYGEAEVQFQRVVELSRKDGYGYYGLGLAYNRMGRYDDAIGQLKQAVSLKKDFAAAHYELGSAYGKAGRKDDAAEQLSILSGLDQILAGDLALQIRQPRIVGAFSANFMQFLGPQTTLAELDGSLAAPSASKEFSMTFQFNGDMDSASVENIAKWSISRAAGGKAGAYNNWITLNPAKEAAFSPLPTRIVYDREKMQATVFFRISQNDTGTAVIDPSHLLFRFDGKDVDGRQIDQEGNEYDGFAGIIF